LDKKFIARIFVAISLRFGDEIVGAAAARRSGEGRRDRRSPRLKLIGDRREI
jgi:hypothetical protein